MRTEAIRGVVFPATVFLVTESSGLPTFTPASYSTHQGAWWQQGPVLSPQGRGLCGQCPAP